MNVPRSFREWLRDELPGLIQGEVLDAASAQRLARHYALDDLGDRGAARKLILALLGSILVGAGVVLLFAHNWDELSRPMRAVVSLGQLLLAQSIAAFVLWKHPRSSAGLEGSGAWLTLSIGAAIGLIAQTYHLDGELGDFMLVWIALAAPLVYVMPARIVATLVLCAAPVLAYERARNLDHGFAYWIAVATMLPALQLRVHASRVDGLTLLARWAFIATLPIGAAPLLVEQAGGPWLPFYAGLAASCVALGCIAERGASAPRRPLSIAGGLGTVVLALVLSYDEVIDDLLTNGPAPYADQASWPGMAAFGFALLALTAAAALSLSVLKARDPAALSLIACNAFCVAVYGLARAHLPADTLALASSAALLALGSTLLTLGLRNHSVSLGNKGLAVLALLFVARFFDTELSFIARGVGFVLLGIAFLAVNMVLSRRPPSLPRGAS